MKRYLLLLLIISALSILGCNRSGNDIVGQWTNTAIQETVEFKKDNTGIFQVPGMPSLKFAWKMLGKGQVELDVEFQGKIQPLQGKLSGETLMLDGGGKQQAVYRRSSGK